MEARPTANSTYHYSSSECQFRLEMNQITSHDREVLQKLKPIIEPRMNEIVDSFYGHLAKFPAAVKIIADAGSSVERLKKTNPAYFAEMFKGELGPEYFESRRIVGLIHARIGLEPNWFYAAMSSYYQTIFPILVQTTKFKPKFLADALVAFQKALNLDQALIMEAYIGGLVIEVNRVMSETDQVITNLGNTSTTLRQAATESGGAAQEVAQVTQSLAMGAQTQSEAAGEVMSSVESLAKTSAQVTKSGSEQQNAVQQAELGVETLQALIADIDAQASAWERVRERVRAMEQVKDTVQQTAARVQDMQQNSQHIGAILQTIESIADQTNLLALNAAIEAARAGEHGRGFAVVADEVRKLAENAGAQTREIGNLIRAVQHASGEADEFMQRTLAEVTSGAEVTLEAAGYLEKISAYATEASSHSSQITEFMGRVAELAKSNAALVDQSSSEVTVVTSAIQRIAQISTDNSAASEQVSAAAEEMSAQVQEVTANMLELDEQVAILRNGSAALRSAVSKLGGAETASTNHLKLAA